MLLYAKKKRTVPSDIKKKIKKRHPAAGMKEFRQFMAVFESSKDNGESDSRAYSKAWGVLNQNKNLKDSHTKTNKEETKKRVNKWEKKFKWNGSKEKKSSVFHELKKLAGVLELLGEFTVADNINDIANHSKEVLNTSCNPDDSKIPNAHFHIFIDKNEVGARVNLPFELELDDKEFEELETDIHEALEDILFEYSEEFLTGVEGEE